VKSYLVTIGQGKVIASRNVGVYAEITLAYPISIDDQVSAYLVLDKSRGQKDGYSLSMKNGTALTQRVVEEALIHLGFARVRASRLLFDRIELIEPQRVEVMTQLILNMT